MWAWHFYQLRRDKRVEQGNVTRYWATQRPQFEANESSVAQVFFGSCHANCKINTRVPVVVQLLVQHFPIRQYRPYLIVRSSSRRMIDANHRQYPYPTDETFD